MGKYARSPPSSPLRPHESTDPLPVFSQVKNGITNTSTVPAPTITASPTILTSYYQPSSFRAKTTSSTGQYFKEFNNQTLEAQAIERERLRVEFYATYDVMTGIRIAATLGGFFFFMVFLIVFKSRSHSNKAMNDPKIAAAAAQHVEEEEERELQEAMEKTAYTMYQEDLDFAHDVEVKRERMLSLGNVSCPPTINPSFRFSSVGGYSSLLDPPRRFSYSERIRRKSTSESSSRMLSAFHLNDNYTNQNENFFNETDGEEADDEFEQFTTTAEIAYQHSFLSVPRGSQESRRSSGMTCCSTESSFLERRCSAITLGLNSLPALSRGSSRRASRDTRDNPIDLREIWELEYAPGIQVIEATPRTSPCVSEKVSHVAQESTSKLDRMRLKRSEDLSIDSITEYPEANINENDSVDYNGTKHTVEMRRAPLASLSSFKMSSADFPDSDKRSRGSDSVFVEDSLADTDEDMEQFSTDSDEISLTVTPPVLEPSVIVNIDSIEADHQLPKFRSGSAQPLPTYFEASEEGAVGGLQRNARPASFSSFRNLNESSNINQNLSGSVPSAKSDCVEITMPLSPNNLNNSSSVILELPVIAQAESSSISQPLDLPGTSSRKWSKETLF